MRKSFSLSEAQLRARLRSFRRLPWVDVSVADDLPDDDGEDDDVSIRLIRDTLRVVALDSHGYRRPWLPLSIARTARKRGFWSPWEPDGRPWGDISGAVAGSLLRPWAIVSRNPTAAKRILGDACVRALTAAATSLASGFRSDHRAARPFVREWMQSPTSAIAFWEAVEPASRRNARIVRSWSPAYRAEIRDVAAVLDDIGAAAEVVG